MFMLLSTLNTMCPKLNSSKTFLSPRLPMCLKDQFHQINVQ